MKEIDEEMMIFDWFVDIGSKSVNLDKIFWISTILSANRVPY